MKKNEYNKFLDLLENIKGVDKMIQLHMNEDSNFMLDQYKAKMQKLISYFIDEVINKFTF